MMKYNRWHNSCVVLMYHHVNPHDGDLVTITPEEFKNQLIWLTDNQYTFVFMTDVVDFINGQKNLPPKSVAITFDDGYLDNWIYAYPIIEQCKAKATIFTVTSWLDEFDQCRPNNLSEIPSHRESKRLIREGTPSKVILNWAEAEVMQRSGIIDIQSHTDHHLRILTITNCEIEKELICSRQIIEKRLNKLCNVIAWPWGDFHLDAVKIAEKVGYTGLVTVERGITRVGSDPFAIKRIVVKKGNIDWFRSRMTLYSRPFLGSVYSWWRG